jgi:predicted nucleic acid-binding protein
MKIAIDSNVIIGLWNPEDALNLLADRALESVFGRSGLVICGTVYGELLACPGRTEDFIEGFLDDTGISVEWSSSENIWRTAGTAFQKYAGRRRRQKLAHPRRILTDFYIGAHALCNGYGLLTLDDGIYRAAFPKLQIIYG